MASLTEHVMINKLGDDLDEAITFVGGDTSMVDNIMQYPQVIKDQLSAGSIKWDKTLILEGDSCIIIADEGGRDIYNTEYAAGEKTGLNPGAYYIRICTAVEDIEPVYIDMTPVMELINSGDLTDINNSIKELDRRITELEAGDNITESEILILIENSLKNYVTKSDLDSLEVRVKDLEERPEGVSQSTVQQIVNDSLIEINNRVENLEQESDQDLDYIVQQVIESDTIQNTFVSDIELENMMFTEEELDELLTI